MTDFVSGNIFIRPMGGIEGMAKGDKTERHRHHFDHTTICFVGDWQVKKWSPDGKLVHDFKRAGPFFVLIEKDCEHEFEFLGGAPKGHAWCVYSHRTPQGEVVQQETGWMDAYT